MQYDALKDFDLITVAVQAPNVLVVPANSPHKSRRRRDRLREGAARQDDLRLVGQRLERPPHRRAVLAARADTSGLHVPYKGGGAGDHRPARRPGRRVVPERQRGAPAHQGGKLRALAVTGAKRSPVLPDVPTMAEAGVKDVDVYSWQGIAAPKGLPADIRRQVAWCSRRSAQRPASEAATDRPRARDRRQHAGAVRRLSAAGIRPLEEGDRGSQDHRRLTPSRPRCIGVLHELLHPFAHRAARHPGRRPRQHAAQPERRARALLHAQPR